MKRLLLVLLLAGLLGAGGYGAYIFALTRYWQAPVARNEAAEIFIPKGMSSRQIIAQLTDQHIITHPLFFRAFASMQRDIRHYKAGEYRIAAGASPQAISRMLAEGNVIQRSITIPEGWLSAQAVQALNAETLLSGALLELPAEGSILPETYFFVRTQKREELLRHMQQAMGQALREAWEKRGDNLPFATAEQALILASIVEKETGVAEERPHIAAVFINRLRADIPLQSDPTANYGLYLEQGNLKTRLGRADVEHVSAYNTYLIHGLPPTPICNPGLASIQAVLHPAPSADLYFVADGKGGHVFAATLEAHNHNVAEYRKAIRMKEK